MTELYARVLLWHQLLCRQTGGLALCSAKHRLSRDEARGWATTLRDVSDDIHQFLEKGEFVLDSKGRRVVDSGIGLTPRAETPGQEVAPCNAPQFFTSMGVDNGVTNRKNGGPRTLTRKQ